MFRIAYETRNNLERIMDELAQTEAQKYEKLYATARYQSHDHSITFAKMFLDRVRPPAGSFIVDIGSGPGFAAAFFSDSGFEVLGVDIAINALKEEFRGKFPLLIAPLWKLPVKIEADWGFCADVMEHIPPEKVDAVLTAISRIGRRGCFFNISFRPDGYGQVIGEVLHLTIKPRDWWEAKLRTVWQDVSHVSGMDGNYGCFVCKNPLP